MARDLRDVLIKPMVTEKTNELLAENKYVFKVPLWATKVEIRQAVESIFKVEVLVVNTVRVLGKVKRMGKHQGKRPDYKKAIVKLAPGNQLPIFEGA